MSLALQPFSPSDPLLAYGIIENQYQQDSEYEEQVERNAIVSRSAFLSNDISQSGIGNRLSIKELSNNLSAHLIELYFRTVRKLISISLQYLINLIQYSYVHVGPSL